MMGVFKDTGVAITTAGLYATHWSERPSGKQKNSFNGPHEQLHVHCFASHK